MYKTYQECSRERFDGIKREKLAVAEGIDISLMFFILDKRVVDLKAKIK
jgi:hypothetical protein